MARVSFLLSLLIAAAAAAKPAGKLMVLNSELSDLPSSSSLTPDQVPELLNSMMGFSSSSSSSSSSSPSSKTNLLLVVDGAPLRSGLASSSLPFTPLSSYDVEVPSWYEAEGRELISRMIGGGRLPSGQEGANLADLLCQVDEKASVFALAEDPEEVREAFPHGEVAKEGMNLFGHQDVGVEVKQNFAPFLKNLFDVDGTKFDRELSGLSTLIKSLKESEFGALLEDNSPDSITFVSSSLNDIREHYGVKSSQYKSAWNTLLATIAKIQEEFEGHFSQGSFEVLLVEGQSTGPLLNRQRRSVYKRDFTNPVSPCFASQEVCNNSTSSCSGFGTCTLAKEGCFRCKCTADYAGDSCEFVNIVAPFHIIFWTTLVLLLSLVVICMALAYMDPGQDTLLFRTASKSKRE